MNLLVVLALASAPGGSITIEEIADLKEVTSLFFHEDDLWFTTVQGDVGTIDPATRETKSALRAGPRTLGGTFQAGDLYLSVNGEIWRAERPLAGGTAERVVTGLQPEGAGHTNNNLVSLGEDIYFGNGSPGNPDPGDPTLHSSLLALMPRKLPTEGLPIDALRAREIGALRLVAGGLRNAYGVAADVEGRLLVTDNNKDQDAYPDEVNLITEGAHYGFPEALWPDEHVGSFVRPFALLEPHAAAGSISAYPGGPWCLHEGRAAVALFGGWPPHDEAGRELVLVGLGGEVETLHETDGRPLAIAYAPGGDALYFAEFGGGVFRLVDGRTCGGSPVPTSLFLATLGLAFAALLRRRLA